MNGVTNGTRDSAAEPAIRKHSCERSLNGLLPRFPSCSLFYNVKMLFSPPFCSFFWPAKRYDGRAMAMRKKKGCGRQSAIGKNSFSGEKYCAEGRMARFYTNAPLKSETYKASIVIRARTVGDLRSSDPEFPRPLSKLRIVNKIEVPIGSPFRIQAE